MAKKPLYPQQQGDNETFPTYAQPQVLAGLHQSRIAQAGDGEEEAPLLQRLNNALAQGGAHN